MKTNIFNVKKHSRVGPGGWKCTCCGPAPKHRSSAARSHKRSIYRQLDRLEKDNE